MTALARWWQGRGPVARAVTVVVGLVLLLNVLLATLEMAVGGEPGGADGSSFATGSSGVAAWSELVARQGTAVERLRTPLGEATLPEGATVVLVDPALEPTAADLQALAGHLDTGGRLVVVGRTGTDVAAALTGVDLGWTTGGGDEATVEPGALGGAATLRLDGHGRFVTPGDADVLARDGEAAAVAAVGPIVAVADLGVVSNRGLGEADNAAAALALAGPGPVVFVEDLHGYGEASGLAALPVRWKQAGLALVGVALLGMWSVGRRLGPPERPRRDLPPPRRAYVDALAAAVSRTGTVPVQEDQPRGSDPT